MLSTRFSKNRDCVQIFLNFFTTLKATVNNNEKHPNKQQLGFYLLVYSEMQLVTSVPFSQNH